MMTFDLTMNLNLLAVSKTTLFRLSRLTLLAMTVQLLLTMKTRIALDLAPCVLKLQVYHPRLMDPSNLI